GAAPAATPKTAVESAVLVRFSSADAPDAVVRRCVREYSLQAVFARDVAAAHAEGWITLTGLETPQALAGGVVDARPGRAAATAGLGQFIAIDGPEFTLRQVDIRRLIESLRAPARLTAVLNLNCAAPPVWSEERVAGPLFQESSRGSGAAEPVLDAIVERWADLAAEAPSLR